MNIAYVLYDACCVSTLAEWKNELQTETKYACTFNIDHDGWIIGNNWLLQSDSENLLIERVIEPLVEVFFLLENITIWILMRVCHSNISNMIFSILDFKSIIIFIIWNTLYQFKANSI